MLIEKSTMQQHNFKSLIPLDDKYALDIDTGVYCMLTKATTKRVQNYTIAPEKQIVSSIMNKLFPTQSSWNDAYRRIEGGSLSRQDMCSHEKKEGKTLSQIFYF